MSSKVGLLKLSKNSCWVGSLILSFVISLLIQIYDPLIRYKLHFPISPWELDGRLVFVNGFKKDIYWGRPVQGLLQFILPSSQNWNLINAVSIISTPVVCLLAISILISPRKNPYIFLFTSATAMLLLRTTSGFVSSWAYMSVITNALATFFGLIALLMMVKMFTSERHQLLNRWVFVISTLLSVLSKQDAIFGLALSGLVMFISYLIMGPRPLRQGNSLLLLSLFPIPVILAEYLRNRFNPSFFSANTGYYTRVLNPNSILSTFLGYPGAELSRRIFFATVALLTVLITLVFYSNRKSTPLRNESELVKGVLSSMAVIAFGVGLRFPYLILPSKQIDWYSNYWLLLDFAALAFLMKILFTVSKPLKRVLVSIASLFCLMLLIPVYGGTDSVFGGRLRVEGWFVQRVRENQNIVDFLNTNSLRINRYECVKVLNTNFLTPWIFDSGSYLQSLLGSKIKWSVEVSEDTISFIQQFPEFEYMSSFSNTQNIAIYATGESPELPECGVIRFDGDFSSNGRLIEMRK